MRLYLSERPDDIRRAAYSIQRVMTLYESGIITDDSTVWIRVQSLDPYVWILSDTSRLVRVHLSSDPGCVRITNDRVRWGSTYEASADSPDDTVTFSSLPVDASSSFLYVVQHMNPAAQVSVVAKSATQRLVNGSYDADGIGVIDTLNYIPTNRIYMSPDGSQTAMRRPDDSWSGVLEVPPSEYERAHAMIYGAEFLTSGMPRKKQQHFTKNMDLYCVDLSRSYLSNLVNITSGAYERAAQALSERMLDKEQEAAE